MRIQPKKIMCAIDFSDFTNMVLTYGKVLAKEFNSKLCLCHIVPGSFMVAGHIAPYADYTGIEAEHIRHAQERLEKKGKEFDLDYEIMVGSGYPAEEIAQLARENNVEMVIAATYGGSGVKRFLIGSVTDRLVKILSCPLLVLNPSEQNLSSLPEKKIKLEKILVGCDFSEDSQLAFEYALGLAQEFQTKLYLSHVVRPVDQTGSGFAESVSARQKYYPAWNMTDYMELKGDTKIWEHHREKSIFEKLENQLLNMLPKDCGNWCAPVTVLLKGAPYKELISYAQKEEVDMIVLGIHGHNLLEKFLVGSTTDRIISRAPCPVLAVRTPVGASLPDKKDEIVQEVKKDHITSARDIMETNVIKVSPDTDIITAVKILLENQINGMPVVDGDDRLQGILCQSDLIFQQKEVSMPPVFSLLDGMISLSSSKQLDEECQKIAAVNVEQAMVKNPVTAHLDMPISAIASLMVEKHFHTIPVVMENKLVGVIGKEDVLKILIST
jgi:nucleotide-binding universal stress UspA family protein/predicted transcriptional regulator